MAHKAQNKPLATIKGGHGIKFHLIDIVLDTAKLERTDGTTFMIHVDNIEAANKYAEVLLNPDESEQESEQEQDYPHKSK